MSLGYCNRDNRTKLETGNIQMNLWTAYKAVPVPKRNRFVGDCGRRKAKLIEVLQHRLSIAVTVDNSVKKPGFPGY